MRAKNNFFITKCINNLANLFALKTTKLEYKRQSFKRNYNKCAVLKSVYYLFIICLLIVLVSIDA